MSVSKLESKIIEVFSVHWEHNDRAHRIEHFQEVYMTGLDMIERLKLSFSKKHLMFASYFHDLFAWSRDNHHKLSEEFVLGTCHPLIADNLSKSERVLVAGACRHHRASNREPFNNKFEEFFNAADRERPKSVDNMLKRAIQYREDRNPGSSDKQNYVVSVKHLKEKYGHGGYANYSEFYLKAYSADLQRVKDEIEELYKEVV